MMPAPATPSAPSDPAALSVVIVGPDRFDPVGQARAARLGRGLADAGHDVRWLRWVGDAPLEDGPAPDAVRTLPVLSRSRPDTWLRAGHRLAGADLVLVLPTRASLVPPLLALLRSTAAAVRPGSRAPQQAAVLWPGAGTGQESPGVVDGLLRRLLGAVDAVIVHDIDGEQRARRLGAGDIVRIDMPRNGVARSEPLPDLLRLLLLRPSLDPDEMAGLIGAVDGLTSRMTVLNLAGVAPVGSGGPGVDQLVVDGLPQSTLASLLDAHDVLVLTSESTSSDVDLAVSHSLSILLPSATEARVDGQAVSHAVADFASSESVRAGLDALRRRRLGASDAPVLPADWANYVARIELLVGTGESEAAPVPATASTPSGGAARRLSGLITATRDGARAQRRRLRPHVVLHRDDLPAAVMATDVLIDPEQVRQAVAVARGLGLPRSRPTGQAWAALGALAAVVRLVRDPGSAVVVDESGPRSVLTRWMRAVGFEPVLLDFTGPSPSISSMDVDASSLDVIVRIHPQGCDADSVDRVIEQASWALKPGGVLVVTVPLGPASAEGCVGPADVRAVLARADSEGLVLVGNLDGHLLGRMNEARDRARRPDSAHGLVRLAWRKR